MRFLCLEIFLLFHYTSAKSTGNSSYGSICSMNFTCAGFCQSEEASDLKRKSERCKKKAEKVGKVCMENCEDDYQCIDDCRGIYKQEMEKCPCFDIISYYPLDRENESIQKIINEIESVTEEIDAVQTKNEETELLKMQKEEKLKAIEKRYNELVAIRNQQGECESNNQEVNYWSKENQELNKRINETETRNEILQEEINFLSNKLENCSIAKTVDDVRQDKLDSLREEVGELGGSGHFFGEDSRSVRGTMGEEAISKVLRLLSLGETKLNLKFWFNYDREVTEDKWKLTFKHTRDHPNDLDINESYFCLANEDKQVPFEALIEHFFLSEGEVLSRLDLFSSVENKEHCVNFKDGRGNTVRINILLL